MTDDFHVPSDLLRRLGILSDDPVPGDPWWIAGVKSVRRASKTFNPDQPRDWHGRWTNTGFGAPPAGGGLGPDDPRRRKVTGTGGSQEAVTVRRRLREISGAYKGGLNSFDTAQNEISADMERCWDRMNALPYNSDEWRAVQVEMDGLMSKSTALYQRKHALEEKALAKQREALRVPDPISTRITTSSKFDKGRMDTYRRGVAAFDQMVSKGGVYLDGMEQYKEILPANQDGFVDIKAKVGRAECSGHQIRMAKHDGETVVVHEMGHWLENNSSPVRRAAKRFYDTRTAGQTSRPLGDRYRPGEVYKPDKFYHPYMGKDYGGRATEIFSMGLQEMWSNPSNFADKDPEYFDFIYDTVRGW